MSSSRFLILALAAAALAGCRDITTLRARVEGESMVVVPAPVAATAGPLHGKTIAILATDGFEQVELVKPRQLLAGEGAKTVIVAPKAGFIQGVRHLDRGDKVAVDLTLDKADPTAFDALVLPGGVANPDALRGDPTAVRFVQAFVQRNLVVAAICHAPWMLIEAGVVRDRTMTSSPSLKMDLLNAGAVWVDREVQSDRGVITSRRPDDIGAFVRKTTEELLDPTRAPHEHATR